MLNFDTYMLRCLQLARLSEYYVAPNPMVGAALVCADGTILSEGWHEQYGGPHAEVNCLNSPKLTSLSKQCFAQPTTLFVTLEPCSHFGKTPPCAKLILDKQNEYNIQRVVIGTLDPNPKVAGQGIAKLQTAGIEVITGVQEEQCRELNRRFLCLHEKHRPYIILKWAQSADGFIGVSDRRLVISNPISKQMVHKMRAENMAIMVGTNTALIDNPKLLNTHWAGRNPIRILVDRHNRVPKNYNIFSNDAPTIVYSDNTNWTFIINDLAQRNIHSVIVEGGTTLLNHILNTDIYDEIHIEVNPTLHLKNYTKAVPAPNYINGFGAVFDKTQVGGNNLYVIKRGQ